MKLQYNRYYKATPSCLNEQGTLISVPIYVSPTMDGRKALLNGFRAVKQKQLIEMGYSQEPRVEGSLSIHTATSEPQTQIEYDLGTNEESLRMLLFAKQGLQDTLILKLQQLTGIEVVTKEEIAQAQELWLNHLYGHETTKSSTKKSNSATKRSKAATTTA